MLSIFNRFLSRIRSVHPLFSNKDLLILVFEYLDGEDLYQVYQVSFLLKITIESIPNLEITLLKFRMKKSNECIRKMKNSLNAPPASTTVIPKFAQRMIMPSFPMFHKSTPPVQQKNFAKKSQKVPKVDLNDEKWVNFVDQFQKFAEFKGFKISNKNEFGSKEDWKKYKVEYLNVYDNYVDYIKKCRARYEKMQQEREADLSTKVFHQYKKILHSLNFGFHTMTNYRYFPNKSERNSKPPPDIGILI